MMQNPWKTIKKNIIYQNNFGYTLRDDDIINPIGKPGKFMVLEHDDFSVIIAITSDKKIVMVRQWRYAKERECLELPAGSINKDEDVLNCAKRELQEETGYTSNNWQELKSYESGLSCMRMTGHIFLAQNAILSAETHQDDSETITVETYTYKEIMDMVDQNIISDEKTLLSLLLVQKYL